MGWEEWSGRNGDKRAASFWTGLITGLGAAAVVLALAVGFVSRSGLVVTVETGSLKERIETEVRGAVRAEMPRAISTVKAELPGQVGAEARRRLTGARMDLGGFEVELPPGLVDQLEQTLVQAVRLGLEVTTSQVNMDKLADEMGGRAAQLAHTKLDEALQNQTVPVEIIPGLTVPVHIRTR